MKLHFTPRAIADLEEIAEYLIPLSPPGALKVRHAIIDTLQNLVDFPRMGRRQTLDGVRKIGVRKYPYLVYYTVDDGADEIIILTIQHASRERDFSDA